MIRPVQFRVEAREDVRQATAWYAERSSHAAAGFREQLAEAIALIQSAPEAFPPRYRGVRRAGLRRYPYGIYYRIEEQVIDVIAVLHGRRHPRRWRRRS
ncbi:MAG: type II toxin-antitoxin system RelE/ParE family toxin [Gemmatimonadaceae bacterium]